MCYREKLIQYKDIREQEAGSQRPQTQHWKSETHNSEWFFSMYNLTSFLQDLAPIFWF